VKETDLTRGGSLLDSQLAVRLVYTRYLSNHQVLGPVLNDFEEQEGEGPALIWEGTPWPR